MSADRILKRLERCGMGDHVRDVARQYRISLLSLCGTGTARPLGEARAKLYGRLRKWSGLSYPEIGKLVERGPATVRWQIRQYCPMWADNWRVVKRNARIARGERRLRVGALVDKLKAQNRAGLPLRQ